jgi:hypothetical protein
MPFFLPVAAEALESKMAPQCRDHLFFFSSPPSASSFFCFSIRAVERMLNQPFGRETKKKK